MKALLPALIAGPTWTQGLDRNARAVVEFSGEFVSERAGQAESTADQMNIRATDARGAHANTHALFLHGWHVDDFNSAVATSNGAHTRYSR